jgi:hypothetical protein
VADWIRGHADDEAGRQVVEEVRGRIELGVKAQFPNGIGLDLSGSYDGIGSRDFQSVGTRSTTSFQPWTDRRASLAANGTNGAASPMVSANSRNVARLSLMAVLRRRV